MGEPLRSQRRLLPWFVLGGYIALIFFVSSRPHLQSPITFPLWDKVAHLIEYAVLGFLAGRVTRSAAPEPQRPLRLSRGALLFGAGLVIGALDECLQSTVPGREASVWDWGVDGVGAFLGLLLSSRSPKGWIGALRAGGDAR